MRGGMHGTGLDARAATRARRAAVRLNLGCGPNVAPGWLNVDLQAVPGAVRGDLRAGLPLADASVDCIAAIHLLQDLPWPDIAPALAEMRRVLRPGGVLRLAVPDLERALRAYLAGDRAYWYVPDEHARSAGAKLVTQIVWYGSVRTPCTWEFLREWLVAARYRDVRRCTFGETRSAFPELASLDNRERETLFVEATR
jgi:SAM-dependent methyltransferase